MLSLPASKKRIRFRTAEIKWSHHFSHCKPIGFFRLSRAANSAADGPIKPKFVLDQALMHVNIACKYENDQMKNSEKKWRHRFFHNILSVTMETSGWIWPNFKLIHALMYVIITCKYEKNPIKNSREKVETSFPPL